MKIQKSKNNKYYKDLVYKEKHKKICTINNSYDPSRGWIKDSIKVNGKWIDVPEEKQYVKYPKNSNMQKYYKKYSNRRFRRNVLDELPAKGNHNRKYTEYWWILW